LAASSLGGEAEQRFNARFINHQPPAWLGPSAGEVSAFSTAAPAATWRCRIIPPASRLVKRAAAQCRASSSFLSRGAN
jgi:hypothetical protein